MATITLEIPTLVGLIVGVAFIIVISTIFNSVTPIVPPTFSFAPLPEVVMIYNGTEYTGQTGSYIWGGTTLYAPKPDLDLLQFIEVANNINGSVIQFVEKNPTSEPPTRVDLYVYDLQDAPAAIFERDENYDIYGNAFVVDDIDEGDYYLRVFYNGGDGYVSYYFGIHVT